jgi:hypothetical protein
MDAGLRRHDAKSYLISACSYNKAMLHEQEPSLKSNIDENEG